MSIRGFNSFTVRSGSVLVPVYHSERLGYHSFVVSWSIAGKRQRRKFSDAAEAHAFATNIADQLCPCATPDNIAPRLTELIRAAKVEPRHNGFRDSYASHRLAILQDAAKVSEETGHSPAQLRRSYREIALPDGRLITPQLSRRYFAIVPKPV